MRENWINDPKEKVAETSQTLFGEIIVYINPKMRVTCRQDFEPVNNFFIFVWDHVIFYDKNWHWILTSFSLHFLCIPTEDFLFVCFKP